MDWLNRPENREYYRGSWRRNKIAGNSRAPDTVLVQGGVQNSINLDNAVRQRLRTDLLRLSVQDLIIPENVLLLGFIAEITGDTDQNLIAKTLPRLFSRGRRVLNFWLLSKSQKLEA